MVRKVERSAYGNAEDEYHKSAGYGGMYLSKPNSSTRARAPMVNVVRLASPRCRIQVSELADAVPGPLFEPEDFRELAYRHEDGQAETKPSLTGREMKGNETEL